MDRTTMNYDRDLAFNLRIRGLSEAEISETLDEVRAHVAATGMPAKDEFGSAQEYAKQFPQTKRRTRGTIITTVGVALSVAYLVVAVLLLPFLGFDVRVYVGPRVLLQAVVLALGSVLIGFLADVLRPAPRSHPAG
jgi:hypothetical protein